MGTNDLVSELIRSVLGTTLSIEEVGQISSVIRGVVGSPRLPGRGESAAFALRREKTAALCYDRVWGVGGALPADIAFCGDSDAEIRWLALIGLFELFVAPRLQAGDGALDRRWIREYTKLLGTNVQIDPSQDTMREMRSLVSRTIVSGIDSKYGIGVTPILESEAARERLYRQGDVSAVYTLLSDVPVISEDGLTWEQVVEFRRDSAAKLSLRRMLHWLDGEMVGKSLSYIEEDVAIRLKDYDESVRKHGLHTVVGTLSALLDSKFLENAATVTGVSALLSGGIGALIAGAALTVSKASVHLAEVKIDAEEERSKAAGPIAFVVAARELSPAPAGR
jgi:hypothetical protein